MRTKKPIEQPKPAERSKAVPATAQTYGEAQWCYQCGDSGTRRNPVAKAKSGMRLCFRCYEEFTDLFVPFMMRQSSEALGVFMGALERSRSKARKGQA